MKHAISVVAVLFMTLASFGGSSLAQASEPELFSIKEVTVRLEADSGPAMGSRLALAASRLEVELTQKVEHSQTSISKVSSGQVQLNEPALGLSLSLVVSKIVTPGRYIGTPEDEVIFMVRVLLNGKEIGQVSSSAGSLDGIALYEAGSPVAVAGGEALPVVTVKF